jgi:hypothetical protein
MDKKQSQLNELIGVFPRLYTVLNIADSWLIHLFPIPSICLFLDA